MNCLRADHFFFVVFIQFTDSIYTNTFATMSAKQQVQRCQSHNRSDSLRCKLPFISSRRRRCDITKRVNDIRLVVVVPSSSHHVSFSDQRPARSQCTVESLVPKADRRVATILRYHEERESRVQCSDIHLLLFDRLHRDTVRLERLLRGEGSRFEVASDRSTKPLAHGRNELLLAITTQYRHTPMCTAHGDGLADYQATSGPRHHGEKREARSLRCRFLRGLHARRRVLLQHRVRNDDD